MSVTIDPSTKLAHLVTEHPDLAAELERRALDYCCGGQQTLADACRAGGLEPDVVARELAERATAAGPSPWTQLDAAALVDHLQDTHHAYLHVELPRISELATKVGGVHGRNHPELAAVASTFGRLRSELEPHLATEEQVIFPLIRRLSGGNLSGDSTSDLQGAIGQMLLEHDHAGELIARLRDLTSGYTVPDDGCASYVALYRALEQVESDTHLHVHIENNRLVPMVAELEATVARSETGARR